MEDRDVKVYLSTDGQMDLVESFVLCVPTVSAAKYSDNPEEAYVVDFYASAELDEMYVSAVACYDQFLHAAAAHSDQEIFDLCKEYDVDYDNIMEMVRVIRDGN